MEKARRASRRHVMVQRWSAAGVVVFEIKRLFVAHSFVGRFVCAALIEHPASAGLRCTCTTKVNGR